MIAAFVISLYFLFLWDKYLWITDKAPIDFAAVAELADIW